MINNFINFHSVENRVIKCKAFSNGNDITDNVISISIETITDTDKFFGYGAVRQLSFDYKNNPSSTIELGDIITLLFNNGVTAELNDILINFKVTEKTFDKKENVFSFTANDAIYLASDQIADLGSLNKPYTIEQVLAALVDQAEGIDTYTVTKNNRSILSLSYPDGINVEGTESIRELFDALAEATQTVYYMEGNNIKFIELRNTARVAPSAYDSAIDCAIGDAFILESETSETRTLTKLVFCNSLGDSIFYEVEGEGETQYIRDNPFYELREDKPQLIKAAMDEVQYLKRTVYDLTFTGNPGMQPFDYISLSDGKIYFVSGSFTFSSKGAEQNIYAEYEESPEDASNPSNLGDALKQTYARVNKAEKTIDIVASNVGKYDTRISTIELLQDNIKAEVSEQQKVLNTEISLLNESITEVTNKVSASVTSQLVEILVSEQLQQGVDNVTTTTGFTFNENGLAINKIGSEMATVITEDGMSVYKEDSEVLEANNKGVLAKNLHATTYLIIGENSRFEDYGSNRTACFWIGG